MIFLRQSTAGQEVLIGPFVDQTDAVTPETALSIANTDIKIWKTGATTLANKNSGGATHISGGYYYAVFDATDTDTIGPGKITCNMSGACPLPPVAFCVLDEVVFDVLFGTAAPSTLTASAVLATALTESYSTAGETATLIQLLYEIRQNLTQFALSGTTKTVKKLDGSTTAATYTLDDAETPTSITRAT